MKSKDDLISEADSSRKLLHILSLCEEARQVLDGEKVCSYPYLNGEFGSEEKRTAFLSDWLHDALTYLEERGIEHGILKPEKPVSGYRPAITVNISAAGCVSKQQAMLLALKGGAMGVAYASGGIIAGGAGDGIIAGGRTVPSSVDDPCLEWNNASTLPPVACELLLDIDGKPTVGFRTSYVTNKDSTMSYRLADNSQVEGRFRWTYP